MHRNPITISARSMCTFLSSLLLVSCYLPGVQAGAFESHPLDAFLAGEDFEDARPKQARQPLTQRHISAPHDVGYGAVKLPDVFGDLDVKINSLQEKGKLKRHETKKLSLADTGVKKHALFDDEDTSPHQEFSGSPEDQEPKPSLLEQVAVRNQELAAVEDVTEAKEQELEQQTKQMHLKHLLEQQEFQRERQQQEKQQALLEIDSQNDDPLENAKAAERFFESQADFAGQDTLRPMALPQNHGEASYEGEIADDQVLLQKPNKPVLSQVGAKISAKKGHSMAGAYIVPPGHDYIPNVGQTGEEGEHVQSFNIPQLNKLAIPVLTAKDLAVREQSIKDRAKIDTMKNDVVGVSRRLKADTYKSAKRSTWRLEKRQEMETAVRRAQLLADANRYKAELDRERRLTAEDVAGHERAMHLASEEVKTADETYAKAHQELQEETASGFSVMQAQQETLEGLQSDLQKGKDKANVVEAEAIANITANLVAVSKPSASLSQLEEVASRSRELAAGYARQHAPASAVELYETVSRAAQGDPRRNPKGDHYGLSLAQEHAALSRPQVTTPAAASHLSQERLMSRESGCGGLGQYPCPVPESATRPMTMPAQPVSVQASASSRQQHGECSPQCTWQCDTPKCNEVCEPECSAPRCETRCSAPDVSGCLMACDEPQCAVVCPKSGCPPEGCAECQTTCSEPMCKLQCNKSQPCHNLCEHPVCDWKCKAPTDCPAPQCNMVCDSPKNCLGSTYHELPPLSPGETAVSSFKAPVSLLQIQQQSAAPASTSVLRGKSAASSNESPLQIDVPVTRHIQDPDSMTSKLEQQIISMPVMRRQVE